MSTKLSALRRLVRRNPQNKNWHYRGATLQPMDTKLKSWYQLLEDHRRIRKAQLKTKPALNTWRNPDHPLYPTWLKLQKLTRRTSAKTDNPDWLAD